MAIRLNVQEQNAALRDAICKCSSDFARDPQSYVWLLAELLDRKLDPLRGILAKHRDVPDQLGTVHEGYWLTEDHRFFYFEILVTHSPTITATVEVWRDETSNVAVNPRQPGTGKSFGFIALEVLREHTTKARASVA